MLRRSVLKHIFKEMMTMRQRLDDIENNFSNWKPRSMQVPESFTNHVVRSFEENCTSATKGVCDTMTIRLTLS